MYVTRHSRPVFNLKLLMLLVFTLLTGCALNPWYVPPVVQTKVVYFKNAENANLNQSIPLDLVIIFDKKLVEKFLEMPASEWFAKREQLKRDYPSKLFTWEWELVPGRKIPMFPLRNTDNAQAILVFANYATEGDHRARLDPYEIVLIELQERKFEIKPVVL